MRQKVATIYFGGDSVSLEGDSASNYVDRKSHKPHIEPPNKLSNASERRSGARRNRDIPLQEDVTDTSWASGLADLN